MPATNESVQCEFPENRMKFSRLSCIGHKDSTVG